MTLVQLRHLISLARTGSFSKSAAALFLTQPALSRSIRALEAELGQPLFDRVGRHSEVTPFGREVIERAHALVLAADDLRDSGQRMASGMAGALRVGLGSGPGAMLMTPLLMAVATRHPRLRLEISRGRTDLLVYPPDWLKQLKTLAGEKPLGLRDPGDQLKPLLKQAKVEFEDLEKEGGLDAFHGRLAIAIFTSKEQVYSETREHFFARAKQDLALVWIQPVERKPSAPVIPAHVTRLGAGAVVIAEPSAIANLKDSALSQLNLLGFAELALNPDSPLLPNNPQ